MPVRPPREARSGPAELIRTLSGLDDMLMPARLSGSPVTFVPTMGALHDGHRALMRAAREVGDVVVVSIFVNPTQFAPGEDLEHYPRDLEHDVAACAQEGVDIVYVPEVAQIYPDGLDGGVTVDPGPLGGVLEGVARPTHFRGVLTVLTKLFALVRPTHAYFGEKDYQQLALVRAMQRDLCGSVEIVGVETVRDADGLALSSRNRHLEPSDRQRALVLSRALAAGEAAAQQGADAALAAARAVLDGAAGVEVDYLALTDPRLAAAPPDGPARLLVAARVGGVRLVDNVALELGSE